MIAFCLPDGQARSSQASGFGSAPFFVGQRYLGMRLIGARRGSARPMRSVTFELEETRGAGARGQAEIIGLRAHLGHEEP